MLEPLSPSSTFELCVQALARALQVDVQPHTHEDRLLLVHYFAALVIGGQVPVHAHDGLGNTVLHYAARIGWAAGVASIFNSRVLDDDSKTGSLWDSEEKSLEQVQGAAAAVIRKNSSGCSALHCASVSGCLRTLHLLLQIAGDTVQDGYAQRDEITTSEKQRSEGTCDCTAVDYSNRTLLHYAGDLPPYAAMFGYSLLAPQLLPMM
jgi:ankyrin repeat protein